MRIVFMGSPEFAVPSLEHLQNSPHEVVAVITQPDRATGRKLKVQPPPVKTAAERFGLPVLQPLTTRTPEFTDVLASYAPDVLVVVAYGEILKKSILDLPPHGAVNLHASLLPRYRGAAPVAWAILNGEKQTGVTTMRMNEKMDAGPIFLQDECPIGQDDTASTLNDHLSQLGASLIRKTLDLLEAGLIEPIEQDPSLISYAPKLKKEDGLVNWMETAQRIARQIRAFDPWPGTYSYRKQLLVKFWKASSIREEHHSPEGTILRTLKNCFHVACGAGSVLEVIRVQPENRSRMNADQFVHGYRVHPGDQFASASSR